jgi:hypothetical protein
MKSTTKSDQPAVGLELEVQVLVMDARHRGHHRHLPRGRRLHHRHRDRRDSRRRRQPRDGRRRLRDDRRRHSNAVGTNQKPKRCADLHKVHAGLQGLDWICLRSVGCDWNWVESGRLGDESTPACQSSSDTIRFGNRHTQGAGDAVPPVHPDYACQQMPTRFRTSPPQTELRSLIWRVVVFFAAAIAVIAAFVVAWRVGAFAPSHP